MAATARPRARLTDADPILFDLDGTLMRSGSGVQASVVHTYAVLGLPAPDAATLNEFIGPPIQVSFQRFAGLTEDQAWEAVAVYRAHYLEHGLFDADPYDGIVDVLGDLQAAGRVLAVATSKAEPMAQAVLDRFGLAGYFASLTGSELDGTRSAKSEVVAEALVRLGIAPGAAARAVMIGDRSHDMSGARANGLPAIGAVWGYGTADELVRSGATALAHHPRDLLPLLLPDRADT